MTKTPQIIIGIIIIVVIVVLVVVFGGKKEEKGPIKIGAILPLTGKLAQYGGWTKNGIDLAVEEVNSLRDHPYKLEVIYEDNASDSKMAVNAMQKLISRRLPIVVGLISSRIALSCAPVAEQNRVVLLSTGASAMALREAGDYIFRVRESGMIHGQGMADFVWRKWGTTKKVGILSLNAENGITYSEAFKKQFSVLGGSINFYEKYEVGEKDFRTLLLKAKKKRVNILYIPGEATEIGLILKQAKELGLNLQFLSSVGAESPKVIELAGKAAEGLIYTSVYFSPDSEEEKIKQFVSSYTKKFGEKPTWLAANSYDAIKLLAKVFRKYGYSSEQIKNGLYKIKDFKGVSGTMSFDGYGDVIKPIMFKTIKNGQFVPYEE